MDTDAPPSDRHATAEAGPEPLPEEIALAFAPLHKRALGTAVGVAFGLLVFVVTAFHVLTRPQEAIELGLLAQYFYGYTVSWKGAFLGFFWGLFTGFVAGWFLAFSRNLLLATWIFVGRAKSELTATRDFLDHI
jgi:hypothetical protein